MTRAFLFETLPVEFYLYMIRTTMSAYITCTPKTEVKVVIIMMQKLQNQLIYSELMSENDDLLTRPH